jgi:16S rRNA A1518/A1519 N6-dimethyltransferase RsmA/KsgA/DIM1 with predicted DNA glycosylase/AP lyase activity
MRMDVTLDPEEREIRALLELVPSLHRARVIEVGCGDGRLTRRYAARAESVLAFDPDETAIAELLSDLPPGNLEVRTDTVDRIDIPEGSADVVLLSWAL